MDPQAAAQRGSSDNEPNEAGNGILAELDALEENKFQKAIASWRNINLTALIPDLDSAASDLVSHQRDALTQRKDLAQKTKDFRKLDDTAKLAETRALLKSYQTFIDLITNQSKAISAAFFQVYSPLSEAPDPYPLLEASVDSLVTAEETVPKLQSENEQLRRTVNKLTAQLEDSEKKLERERTTRQDLEQSRDSQIKEVETTWGAVLKEKQDNWEAKERNLEEKVENQDRLLKEIKASYEVSQRLGKGDETGGESAHGVATAAELEIVSSELEKASIRLAEVEARNEQLRLELAQSVSHNQTSQPAASVQDDPAFLRLQSENSALLRKLDSARFEKDSEKGRLETETRNLEREIATLKTDRDALREKVQKWGDYENIRQELEVLKSIEFATGDEEDADNASLPADASLAQQAGKDKGETLEQLLLARNKKLNNELTVLRVSHQDLQSRLETLQEELSNTNMELEKSRILTATLENDLEKVQQEASNTFPSSAMSVAGTYTSRYPKSSYGGRRGRSSPTSSIISGFDPDHGQPSGGLDLPGGAVGGGSGILPMVTAQRDRFKKKNSELETELAKTYETVSSLRSEIASLQKDNLNLYEKTRYVSSYSTNRTASSGATFGSNSNPSTIHVSADTPSGLSLDNRYQSAYEQRISPFAAFRGRETARALRRMSLPERMVFRVTRLVLATRLSRNLFAAYCMALHVLVFCMLYWMGSTDIDQHSMNVAAGAAAGAAAAAVGAGTGGTAAGPAGGPLAGGASGQATGWHQQEGFSKGG